MPRVNISELNIKLTASSKGLSSELNGATKRIRGFADETKSINSGLLDMKGALLGVGAAAGGLAVLDRFKDLSINFVKDSVELAGALETAQLQFETILKDAQKAKDLIGSIQLFANATPFESAELVSATKQLLAYGFTAKDILPTLRSLGDIAAASGSEINDLAQIYGRAFAENRIQGEELNRLSDRAIPIFEVLGRLLNRNAAEVRKLGSEGKLTFKDLQRAFADLTAEGGAFAGATERLAGSVPGQLSTLSDSVDELRRQFGEGLNPATREAIALMGDLVELAKGIGTTFNTQAQLGVIGLTESIKFLREQVTFLGLGVKMTAADFGLLDADTLMAARIEAGNEIQRIRGLMAEPMAPKQDGIASLIGPEFPAEIKSSREALAKLESDAKATAAKIREEFATPLDKFRQSIELIIQADEFGGLDMISTTKAIQAEVDKITKSAIDAQRALREMNVSTPLIRKGSQEDYAARDRLRAGVDNVPAQDPAVLAIEKQLAAIVAGIRAEVAAQVERPGPGAGSNEMRVLGADSASEYQKFVDALKSSNEPKAAELEKVTQEIQRQASLDRAVLNRIASAVEKQPAPLTIREYSA
jgi:tape measure domain-containing protein